MDADRDFRAPQARIVSYLCLPVCIRGFITFVFFVTLW
jgi:hypothetical protein